MQIFSNLFRNVFDYNKQVKKEFDYYSRVIALINKGQIFS
jgi:hypothetical protein